MYNRSYWVDHVVNEQGEIVQLGTMMDQGHFNNMEHGISDQSLAEAIMQFHGLQQSYVMKDEEHAVTMTGTGTKWPFNNSAVTVALDQIRESTDYAVEINVLNYSGGRLGHIKVYDRADNGFKLLHDGSATSINMIVRVVGGFV